MNLKIVTPPVAEPVTWQEALEHLRIQTVDEEVDVAVQDYLARLIEGARREAETFTHRAFVTQTWDMWLPGFPAEAYIEIPKPPLISITGVYKIDSTETETALTVTTDYLVDDDSTPGKIFLPYGESWPSATLSPNNGVRIRFVCGYGGADYVPAGIKQAMLMMIANEYDNRETLIVGQQFSFNPAIDRKLWPYRHFGSM